MIRARLLLLAPPALGAPALAEVTSVGESGFETHAAATVTAAPARVITAVSEIGRWWNPAHSYSGKGANLSLQLMPGGCFCEALPSGGVEHARVVYVDRAGGIVRLRGALGPLQAMGTEGALTISAKAGAGGTTVAMDYAVGGYFPAGAKALAPLVDRVVTEQLERLRDHLAETN